MISDKMQPYRLDRKALLYMQKSTAQQVLRNRESGAL